MKTVRFASVTNRILVMKFASEFILIYPLVTIMFTERGHVSAAGIGFLLGLAMILQMVFEVPTGVIADKFPRKYVLAVSLFFKALCFFVYLIAPSFAGYIVAAVLYALSASLESGALQAYLYGVIDDGDKKSFGKFWSRVSALVMVSYTLAYVLTTIIGVHYPLLLIMSIVPILLAFLICLSLPTDSIAKSHKTLRPKIFSGAVKYIIGSKELIKLLLSGVIVVALAGVVIDFISLYYKQIGIDTRWVPMMLAAGNIVGAVMFWTLHSWEHILEKHRIVVTLLATVIFIATLRSGLVVLSISILLYTRLFRVLQVQYESKLQHMSSDEARATISSIGSFASLTLGALIAVLIGHFAVNEMIVKPLQISLIAGGFTYAAIHGFIRYKQHAKFDSNSVAP